ncbi:hypothetical protein [Chryseobacterium sp. MMS23-Vi53]|uniref:hypothetical protein n=1 Tax=Chryseobacterium sp. MMS23-Vi53 TaxID=3386644 RepID=UPI0039EA213A
MGLDYSIITFVRKEKIEDSLNWLNQNSIGDDRITLRLDNEKYVDFLGHYFNEKSQKIENEKIFYDIDDLDFSTSLIFDIDPEIFLSFYNPYSGSPIEDFKKHFEDWYLGNGKISIGSFDSTINKHKDFDVYTFSFTAVTTSMSVMLHESLSVKNWIHEFSKVSDSIVTFIDLESSGDKILYYKGEKVEILVKDEKRNIKLEDLENLEENHLYEYYKLTEFYYQ